MNTEKKIEQFLKAAPKPSAPDSLLNELQENIALEEGKQSDNIIRRFLSPVGGQISLWRVAAVVVIATMVLIPLTYAGGKIIKTYIFSEGPKVEVIENEDGSVAKVGSLSVSIASDDISSEEELAAARQEIDQLRKAGQYERILLRQWDENGMRFSLYKVSYTLSNGKVLTVSEIQGGSIPD